MYKTTVLTS